MEEENDVDIGATRESLKSVAATFHLISVMHKMAKSSKLLILMLHVLCEADDEIDWIIDELKKLRNASHQQPYCKQLFKSKSNQAMVENKFMRVQQRKTFTLQMLHYVKAHFHSYSLSKTIWNYGKFSFTQKLYTTGGFSRNAMCV